MTTVDDRRVVERNEHMTFKANMGVGRHGWLRLTPAYGVRLVRERIALLPEGSVVTDPFSGTGTTPLAAAEHGLRGQSVDVNPFLIWLGTVKTRNYSDDVLLRVQDAGAAMGSSSIRDRASEDLWQPKLFKIEKWWGASALHALKIIRSEVDVHDGEVRDLLDVAFCRTLISCSNAAFNHQSMSFKDAPEGATLFDKDEAALTFAAFDKEVRDVVTSARLDLLGSALIEKGDSRDGVQSLKPADLVLTSPPYVNRMSYIRELRPYMYWLRHLDQASDAGDLDWRAIGGTWGTATSKLNTWEPTTSTPVDERMAVTCAQIRADGEKNGPLLATYVQKYFHDMWLHFEAITSQVKPGGRVSYIVGNSTFYGNDVPAQEWYAEMLTALGYESVLVETIRKRNSNKKLYEYDVTGTRA